MKKWPVRSRVSAVVAFGACVLSAPVLAADFAAKAPHVASNDWSGFYAGLNAGLGWSRADWLNTMSAPPATFFDYLPGQGFSDSQFGVLGGTQAGFNIQNGAWVYGLEATFDAADLSGNFTSTAGAADDQFETRIAALILATGRLGYAWNDWLAYGKAGWAFAKVEVSVADTNPPTTGAGHNSQWRNGFTLGAGLEYRLTPALSVATDYNYVHLDDGSYQLGGGAGNYRWHVDIPDVQLLMVRMNYRFAGPI